MSALKQAEYATSHRSTQDHILDLAASSLQSAENVVVNRVPQIYNKGSKSLSTLSSAQPTSTQSVREVVSSVADKVRRPSTMIPSWATVQAQIPSVARSVFSIVASKVNRDYSGFVAETTARRLSTALPNAALDTIAIQGLSSTVHSFVESTAPHTVSLQPSLISQQRLSWKTHTVLCRRISLAYWKHFCVSRKPWRSFSMS